MNYWAERYLSAEPELKLFQPFTSEDIDFKGGQEDVQHIAQLLELPPCYPAKVEMTVLAGVIPFQIGNLKSNIEIIRRIPGVSGARSEHSRRLQLKWNGMGKTSAFLIPFHCWHPN